MVALRALLVASVGLGLALPVAAQGDGARSFRAHRLAGTREIRVDTRWTARPGGGERTAMVTLTAGERTVRLHDGVSVLTDVATRSDGALVAMLHGGARPLVRYAYVAIGPDDALGTPRVVDVDRPESGFAPATVIATDDATGFRVMWQEVGPGRDSRTYWFHVGADGGLGGAATVVPVPWAIAAIASNGAGYHLALYFDGFGAQSGPGSTTLCLVMLSPDGTPQQHPWFASAPGQIEDVRFARAGERVLVFHRGGPDGRSLFSLDVTREGRWGQAPADARSEGPIGAAEEYLLRVGAGGAEVVRRP